MTPSPYQMCSRIVTNRWNSLSLQGICHLHIQAATDELVMTTTTDENGTDKNNSVHRMLLTDRSWSPMWTAPLTSAGPPGSKYETNIPSSSSPPTMLKPRPDGPFFSTTRRTSLTTIASHKLVKYCTTAYIHLLITINIIIIFSALQDNKFSG